MSDEKEESDKSIKALAAMIDAKLGSEKKADKPDEKKAEGIDVQALLETLLKSGGKGTEPLPAEEQERILLQFASTKIPDFRVGDIIEPTEHGRSRYGIRETTVLVVSEIFQGQVFDDDGDRVHGEIIHYNHGKKQVVPHTVDLRFFRLKKKGNPNEKSA